MRYLKYLLSLPLVMCLTLSAHAFTIVTGTHTGNGIDGTDVVVSPACQPLAVFHIRNDNSSDNRAYLATMGADSSKAFNTTGALAANGIQAVNADGYEVGTLSSVNTDTFTYRYAVVCDNGLSDVAQGTYTGNGDDNTNIVISPAFQPEFVLIIPNTTVGSIWRGASSHSGDAASQHANPAADTANLIQAFNADGFQVGSGLYTNLIVYHYIAFKGSALGVVTGSYTGDTNDSRDITTGFPPQIVFIKGNSTSEEGAIRLASNSGDESSCDSGAAITNVIQAFGATTFQVGTDACANEDTVTMRWAALASTTAAGRNRGVIWFGWLWDWVTGGLAYAY